MKDKILSVLKSCKGHAGYYGITLSKLIQSFDSETQIWTSDDCVKGYLEKLESSNQIYLTRSTQENNRGEIVLICYRESEPYCWNCGHNKKTFLGLCSNCGRFPI